MFLTVTVTGTLKRESIDVDVDVGRKVSVKVQLVIREEPSDGLGDSVPSVVAPCITSIFDRRAGDRGDERGVLNGLSGVGVVSMAVTSMLPDSATQARGRR